MQAKVFYSYYNVLAYTTTLFQWRGFESPSKWELNLKHKIGKVKL